MMSMFADVSFSRNLSFLLLSIECLAALIGIIYFYKLRHSYWKWFCVYLVFICCQELMSFFFDDFFGLSKQTYYTFIGIPIQWLFLYWLYALKALRNKLLFVVSVALLVASYFPIHVLNQTQDIFYSFNLIICTLILVALIILEFIRQIKTNDILYIKENKMFYINIGLILFYIGAFPLHAFNNILADNYPELRKWYIIYFKLSNCSMYLLFIASLIWGKVSLPSR